MGSIYESAWQNCWKTTKMAWGHWLFWACEVFGAGVIAFWSAEYALIFVAALASAIWVVATVTAPIRQRDELRALSSELQDKIEEESAKARSLELGGVKIRGKYNASLFGGSYCQIWCLRDLSCGGGFGLGLLDAVFEIDALDDVGEMIEAAKFAPVLFGALPQFEDHVEHAVAGQTAL